MKVRIGFEELARAIGIGLSVTGKRGHNREALPNILRQLGGYDVFRDANDAEAASQHVPLFPPDFGVARAREGFEAEEEARRRGCHHAWVDTQFGARPFYEKLGYRVFGELPDYPPGYNRSFLQKAL